MNTVGHNLWMSHVFAHFYNLCLFQADSSIFVIEFARAKSPESNRYLTILHTVTSQ